jgi:nucleoside phosphorylase
MRQTILFLAANPGGTDPRALDREARAIQVELERSGFRDCFEFATRWAVEPLDVLRELRKLKPVVVHYSGHGSQAGLFFRDEGGGSRLVSTEALAQTFGAAGASVKVVILSACYSEGQANALLKHVDCVVGMGSSIDDDAARSFAIGFYGGLGEQESVAMAYRQGTAAISLMGLRDSGRPQLNVRPGVDADRLVLAESSMDRHAPSHTPSTSRVDVPALHRKIVAQFSRDEIGQLCMELEEKLRADGIEESLSLDIIGGQGTPEIARNLISHLQRRGLLPYLVEFVDARDLILAAAPAETQASQAGTGTAAGPQPSRPSASKAIPRTVDIGILTIRDDEFRAVLGAFPNKAGIFKGVSREYTLRHADAGNGARYTVATLRLVEQGHGEAQDAARDLIDDLAPRLMLVVGIAGGLPSDDVTLGDVIVSTRIHDFTIEARQAGQGPAYAVTGGPVDRALAAAVANLPAREDELGNWTADLPERPPVSWTRQEDLYGPAEWQSELRAKLEHHHGKGSASRAPRYAAGPIASSDRLVKDPDLLIPWLQAARNLLAIEMESGGVFRAVRERCPMLAIRGISDIVGLKRADAWAKFACASAAAFTRAFLQTRPIEVGHLAGVAAAPTKGPASASEPMHTPAVVSSAPSPADAGAARTSRVPYHVGNPGQVLRGKTQPLATHLLTALRDPTRTITVSPYSAPDTLLKRDNILDTVTANRVRARYGAPFPPLSIDSGEGRLANGLVWKAVELERQFVIGFDASFATRDRTVEARLAEGRARARGDVGIFTTMELVIGAILFVRKLDRTLARHPRWWIRIELCGMSNRKLIFDPLGPRRDGSSWEVYPMTAMVDRIDFEASFPADQTDDEIISLGNEIADIIAYSFKAEGPVKALQIGQWILDDIIT